MTETIYGRIKKLADQQRISIHKIEQLAGISNGIIRKWDNCQPTVWRITAVAEVLGITVPELLGEDTKDSRRKNDDSRDTR